MGACLSSKAAGNADDLDFRDAEQGEKSKEIDKDLRKHGHAMSREIKILLLGAGESGKTTILKVSSCHCRLNGIADPFQQMRLIHTSGFTDEERDQYRTIIFSNMLVSMRTMLEAMELLGIPLELEENDQYIDLLIDDHEISDGDPMPRDFLEPFKSMWADAGIQTVARRGNEYALHDNVHYLFGHLDRIFKPRYVPTNQDILRCRLKTTGITQTIFALQDLTYRMFDVGGQRSERKKWIHCFENVTAVLFLVAVSGYDRCLAEDKEANQMAEALVLFDAICNSAWFVRTSMILFLNKVDLFRQKLPHSPIRAHFPEYGGREGDEDAALAFFQQKFVRLNRSAGKDVYTHFTNATDTTLLKRVMLSVTDIILQKNLQQLIL